MTAATELGCQRAPRGVRCELLGRSAAADREIVRVGGEVAHEAAARARSELAARRSIWTLSVVGTATSLATTAV